ncbi:MAG: cytochrome c-type biogenesis protein CcmH [Acidimicrobiia bacterium]|nr:cytochrome c-type biogenesis protein CcmH [Actinomycetota bacterium]MBL6924344.1 cytochrome c-type biogenesis protein CcmH [Acidimicrobiia bacterium]
MKRRAAWLLIILAATGALMVAETADRPALTNADRVHDLAEDFACPVCQGQSIAESDAPVARTIRATIVRMVDDGATDAEVRDLLVASFGEDIDYSPSGRGLTGLVWVLPVLVVAAAATGLWLAVQRWQGGSTRGRPGGGRPLVLAGVVVVVILAVVLMTRSTAGRGSSGLTSGDIRLSTRTLLIEAGVAPPAEAIQLYGEVLEIQPSNVEALAYRGWALWRSGQAEQARSDLDAAIDLDPAYPDARVFRASQRFSDDDTVGAAADLVVLDGLDAAPIVGDLVAQSHLRERVAGGLARSGEILAALELLDSGLDATPGSASLLAERGWLLAGTGELQLVELSLVSLDEAVRIEPDNPWALGYRALVNSVLLDRQELALVDAEAFFALSQRPTGLADLLVAEGLGPAG